MTTMNRRQWILAVALLPAIFNLNSAQNVNAAESEKSGAATNKIVVGGGCFWCVEAVLQRLPGVTKLVSGYSGGNVKNPTYEQVCDKTTGHAEVVQVEWDPAKVKLDTVLDVFFAAHDPTTPNRQGNDVGPQYRSVIYYANSEQKKAAEEAIKRAGKEWKNPIVTEVAALKEFYPAEAYHQNYYNLNKDKNPYCSYVIAPKVNKLVEKGIIKAQ